MTMRKIISTLILLLSVVLPSYAQSVNSDVLSGDNMIYPQTNDIIPPSPTSATQIRYQSPQPSLATGTVHFSVPLYSLECEGAVIPFSMVYHTSGIKPLDDPLPCGYGWSMQPALKIVRTVRGRPDEHFRYIGDSVAVNTLFNDCDVAFSCMVTPNSSAVFKYIKERCDAEKDIFVISLPSGNITRIIEKHPDGTIEFLGGGADDEIVVTSSGTLDDITVKDARGIIYRFGVEYTEEPGLESGIFPRATTTWGIKEIELPSGKVVNFHWYKMYHPIKPILGGEFIR